MWAKTPGTTPTVLNAGYKVNVIPGVAQAQVDTGVLDRFLSTV